ncbi:thioesterase domain-containing protein [Streptomyces sp. NPDC054765]
MGVGFTEESTSVTVAASAVAQRVVPAARPQAALRLYRVPPAGSGPDCALRWASLLPSWVEPCSVPLPGRGARSGEPSLTDPACLSARLAAVLDNWAGPRPFAVFGPGDERRGTRQPPAARPPGNVPARRAVGGGS